jgi:hypothetical protein
MSPDGLRGRDHLSELSRRAPGSAWAVRTLAGGREQKACAASPDAAPRELLVVAGVPADDNAGNSKSLIRWALIARFRPLDEDGVEADQRQIVVVAAGEADVKSRASQVDPAVQVPVAGRKTGRHVGGLRCAPLDQTLNAQRNDGRSQHMFLRAGRSRHRSARRKNRAGRQRGSRGHDRDGAANERCPQRGLRFIYARSYAWPAAIPSRLWNGCVTAP